MMRKRPTRARIVPRRLGFPKLSKVRSVDQRMRLECGVGFRQLRTCRRTRLGQLCVPEADVSCVLLCRTIPCDQRLVPRNGFTSPASPPYAALRTVFRTVSGKMDSWMGEAIAVWKPFGWTGRSADSWQVQHSPHRRDPACRERRRFARDHCPRRSPIRAERALPERLIRPTEPLKGMEVNSPSEKGVLRLVSDRFVVV